MATRFSATAAAIGLVGLVGGVLAASSAGAAGATGPATSAALPVAQPAAQSAAQPAASIPFSVADPEAAPRPVVTVSIGGVPLLLLLDTGSTGIRVAADKIPAGAVTVIGPAAAYGYGSGIQLHGDQADADVAVGAFRTGPLPIELVRSTDCFADKPDCPAAHGAKPAMFGGVLDGIMGVSPEEISGLVNPLWALHDAAGRHLGRQFAVRYDPALVSGEVMLNVPAAGYGLAQLPRTPKPHHRRARPALLPAEPPSWNPRAVQTCVQGAGLPKSCGPAMFDSGTPEFALNVPGGPAGTWPAGRALAVSVPAAGWSATYRAGAGSGVTVADAVSTTTSGTLIGLPAFAKGPIRFDLEAGTVGFPVPAAPKATPAPTTAPAAAQTPAAAQLPTTAQPPAAAQTPTTVQAPTTAQEPAPQQRGLVKGALIPAAADQPSSPSSTKHPTPKKNYPRLPFHTSGKKAHSLPDTGVPMSAALGAVTALTALLAGIGTVLAARRRPDHES